MTVRVTVGRYAWVLKRAPGSSAAQHTRTRPVRQVGSAGRGERLADLPCPLAGAERGQAVVGDSAYQLDCSRDARVTVRVTLT